MPVPDKDLLDELAAQHRRLREQAGALTGLQLGDERRRVVVDEMSDELVRHLRTEEAALYPLVLRMPDGGELAELELSTHASIEALIGELRAGPSRGPEFDRRAAQLVELVTGHLGEEEATVFTRVRETTPEGELVALGARADWLHEHSSTTPRRTARSMLPPDDLLPPERGQAQRAREFFTRPGEGYQQPADLLPPPEGGHIQRIRKKFDRGGDQRQ